ncbi:diguanylate cyclase [Mycolicibacterium sp. S2-37]|uniref:GGDEF domain-containing protein n=1 Tax=Mycolicibacterium sp. S2-37 TaxID=2810297 RepID=UPI001F5FA4E7|nr:GGDEF domain-containing protein [Mycolicibacterium sp. S2-37]
MTTAVRLMMAGIAGSLAICLFILLRFDGPVTDVQAVLTWTSIAAGIFGVALWSWRWPTHGQSIAFALVSNAAIALSCLAYPNPYGSLVGSVSFATMAAYIAFFHSTALVVYNFAVTTAVAVTAATRIAMTGHPAMAIVDLFIVLQINIAMPVAIYVLVRALRKDLVRAEEDPLTGLLNRRAFFLHSTKLLTAQQAEADCHLLIVLVDLDKFKRVNDTYGHQAGDEALIAVAEAMRKAAHDEEAVIGRSGGEEFVLAAVRRSEDPGPLAERVCAEIAGLPAEVTASVGTATMPLKHAAATPDASVIDRLISAADAAMYHAKRAGGNRCHHFGSAHR